jgi:DNA-binding CsgD family transcriptional regulator
MANSRFFEAAFAFASTSKQFPSIVGMFEEVQAIVEPLGFAAVASGRVGYSNPTEALHYARWKPEWLELYVQRGFMRIDPVPIWAILSGLAVTISDLRTLLPASHPGHEVFDAGRAFGYVGGYVVPQRAADNAVGLVCFIGERDPIDAREKAALRLLADIAFERAEEAAGRSRPETLPMPPPDLSPRERLCLRHIVDGKTSAEIATVMKISQATVQFHATNLRTKTGTRNRTELVSLALTTGLVPAS